MRISDWSSDVCSSDLDVLGTGALEAHHVPGVDDLEIGFRQQERAVLGRLAFREDQAAEEDPVAVIATAGETPAAREAEAAFDRLDLAFRHEIGRAHV